MEILTYINSVINALVVAYFFYKIVINRINITIEKTFWRKIPYGIIIWWITSKSKYGTESTGIFSFYWRNIEKVIELDSKLFKTKGSKSQ